MGWYCQKHKLTHEQQGQYGYEINDVVNLENCFTIKLQIFNSIMKDIIKTLTKLKNELHQNSDMYDFPI
jgi:hypothetical protein